MVKKILVATDFSQRSSYALQRAIQLAHALDAQLSVLHVRDPKSVPWTGLEPSLETIHKATKRVKDDEGRVRNEVAEAWDRPLPDYYPYTRSGKPFIEIIDTARSVRADLIVLGAHGKHFFRDVFLGTTAEKVVRKGDRSVLIVREPPQDDYRRVLVATDFSALSRNALEMVFSMVPNAEFQILHAYQYLSPEDEKRRMVPYTDTEAYMRKLKKRARLGLDAFLQSVDLGSRSVKTILEFGYPPAVIREVARRRRPDLVAIGATGTTDLRHILLGSTATHALRELCSDVLVVRTGAPLFELP